MFPHCTVTLWILPNHEFDFSILNRIIVGQGGFGKIEELEIEKRKYATNNINVELDDSAQVQKVYREVFLLKFADALGVGPKFYQLYGYDILEVAGKSMMFTMELCEIDHSVLIIKEKK